MRKWLQISLFAALSLFFADSSFAQGQLYSNIAWRYTPAGAFPASGAAITICTSSATGFPCTPIVTVYQDSALSMPVVLVNGGLPTCSTSPQIGCLDGLGNFSFYVAPGSYTYSVSGSGLNPYGPIPFGVSCVAGVTCVTTSGNNNFTGLNTDSLLHTFNGGIATTTTNSTGAGTHSGTETFANISKVLFVDGVTNTTLAATLALCPTQGCYIFDSFQETLSANPFASCPAPNADVVIFLSTNIISNVAIVNSCSGITIKGTGRSGSVGFSAGGSFPGSSTLYTVGDGVPAHFVQSSRLEDLSLNCANNTTCVPYVGKNLAENSGVRNVAFTNYFGLGAQITTPSSTNFQFEQTVFAPAATATAASGLQINGIFTDNNPITRISCPFTALQQSGSCVDIENSSAIVRDIHAEGFTNGILVNNSHAVIEGYNTGNGASGTITDHIKITGTGSVVVLDASACGPNYGTNLIHNTVTSFTLAVATTCLLNSYESAGAAEGDIYFYPGLGVAGEVHTGDITVSNLMAATVKAVGVVNSTGIQLFSTSTTCSTSNVIDNACTTGATTLPVGYSDTNYRLSCTGQGPTNLPIVQTYTKSNTTFTITIVALTAAVSTFSSYDCMAQHN